MDNLSVPSISEEVLGLYHTYVWSCMYIVQYSKCTTYKYGMCSTTYSKSYANACLKNSGVFTQLQSG